MEMHNRDRKVHGANIGPIWVMSAPDGPHVGPMILAIREAVCFVIGTTLNYEKSHHKDYSITKAQQTPVYIIC